MKPITFLLGALAVALSLAVALVFYHRYGMADVGYGIQAYTVESDLQVRVQFEVSKDPGRTAQCVVRARDTAGAEVGSDLVAVGPSPQRNIVVTHELATSRRANTGEVTACALQAGSAGPP